LAVKPVAETQRRVPTERIERTVMGLASLAPMTAADSSDADRPAIGRISDATFGEVRDGPREVIEGPEINVAHLR